MNVGISLGIAAGVVHIIGYIIYNWYTRNRPNIAAWGLWSMLAILNASSYHTMSSNWAKSLLTITNSILCILTLILALRRGEFDKVDIWDKLAFGLGLIAGIVWIISSSAIYANLILQVSIGLGFIPIYRGIWRKPDSERPFPWLVWCVGYTLNILTVVWLWNNQWQELAYPVMAIVYHVSVALLVTIRKRQPEVLIMFDDLPKEDPKLLSTSS